jgi:hypothetical protein
MKLLVSVAAAAALLSGQAMAQERPAEDEMFGAPANSQQPAGVPATEPRTGTDTSVSTGTAPATGPTVDTSSAPGTGAAVSTAPAPSVAPETQGAADTRDSLNLGDPKSGTRFSADVAPDDPLKIGGQFYWRVMSSGKQSSYPQNWSLSAPALLDVYLDARPNDRVRAFVLGRMSYDPTLPPNGTTSTSSTTLSAGSIQGSDSLSAMFGQPTRGPSVALDQMWLRFDLLHTVFVTAGKQHVRWGTARFWAPTDYLHLQARNPLLPFDPRTGTTMLKVHVPWEAQGWNFYAYALPESASTATSTPADVAGAARAEVVLGAVEAGAGVFGRNHSKPKFAGDVSFGLWDLDFYGEAALRNASDVDFVTFHKADIQVSPVVVPPNMPNQYQDSATGQAVNPLVLSSLVDTFFPASRGSGWKAQVTGGVSYTRQYADKDTFTVGAEYFYNGLGYDDPRVYPALLFLPHTTPLANPASPFYLGRHYLGVFATAPAPYSWDNTTFTVSNLMNVSDKSGISRLDYSLVVLTHLRFEAYGAVHWGQRNGEFRFGIDGSALASSIPAVQGLANKLTSSPALFDVGLGLRVAL